MAQSHDCAVFMPSLVVLFPENVARMMLQDLFAQVLTVDMGVDLCGGDTLMAKHGLNGAEVGTSLQQVRGKGVAEGMRGNVLGDTCQFSQLLDTDEEGDAAQFRTPAYGHEHIILMPGLNLELLALLKPVLDAVGSHLGYGHQSLFVSFAMNANVSLVQIEVADEEFTEFAHSQTATV